MEFEYDFLDKNVNDAINNFRNQHKNQYELVFMIIKLFHLVIFDKECNKYQNNRQKYIITTINDCYSTFSSEILLLERGLLSDFNILLRSFYEKKFKLFAVINKNDNYKKIIEDGIIRQTKLANNVLNNKDNSFDGLQNHVNKEKYDFSKANKKETSVASWARMADLVKEYNVQYFLLSNNIHYDINSIEDKIIKDKDGNDIYISYSYENFDEIICIVCEEMLSCICKFLAFNSNNRYYKQINYIKNKLDELANNN